MPSMRRRRAARSAPTGKHVVVIGGGDTGSDCIGTANRQGAAVGHPARDHAAAAGTREQGADLAALAAALRTSSSQEEGCERDFSVLTTEFVGTDNVESLRCKRARWEAGQLEGVEGSEFDLKADLVLLGMGFTGTAFPNEAAGLTSERGAIAADAVGFATSRDRVFACGDARRGQSLVVWAIREGRDCAAAVHAALSEA